MIYGFIQGFSPVLPALLITLLGVVSIFISWWTYKHLSSLKPLHKWGLISLRASALFILLLLLLNPFIVRQEVITDNPAIAVYFDNSQSMSVERAEYDGLSSYNQIIDRFHAADQEGFDISTYYFDEHVYADGELDATGIRTNINEVMEHIRVNENRYRAAFMFSDGIVTQGRNPFFSAQNISIPLITVPVGDTTTVRDIAVSDIDYVPTVYTFTRQNIRAEIQQQGFEGEEATVQFIKDGELLQSESIDFTTSSGSHLIDFSIEFEEPGFYDFEVNVPPLPGEFTNLNNRDTFTIEVLDDKTRILSLAFEVHPDVSAIRRLIATDQQNELLSTSYLGNNRFTDGDPRELDEPVELIVLHGLPPQGSQLANWLEEQQTPIVYVATPQSFQRKQSTQISGIIGYRLQTPGNAIDVQIENFLGGISHPLLEIEAVNFQRLPSLRSVRGTYSLSPAAQELAGLLFQRTETDIPLLISEDTSLRRKAAINAFGWHRFVHSQNEEARTFFSQFFTNLISWGATPPDQRLLAIEPTKSEFTENESAGIRATLFNERGDPEPDALIELTIFDGNDDEVLNTFRMNHSQNEIYTAELGNYPQGIYRVAGTATLNDRTIGTAETRINVRQSAIEYLDTRRDDEMLQSLADVTNGLFLEDLNFDEAFAFIRDHIADLPQEEIREESVYLYRNFTWFVIVILLLASEWLLRRYVSLP